MGVIGGGGDGSDWGGGGTGGGGGLVLVASGGHLQMLDACFVPFICLEINITTLP